MTKESTKAPNRRNAKQRTAQRTPKGKAVAKPYEPTPEEWVAIKGIATRKKELPTAPRMKVSETGGVPQVLPDHPDIAVGQILHVLRRLKGCVST